MALRLLEFIKTRRTQWLKKKLNLQKNHLAARKN